VPFAPLDSEKENTPVNTMSQKAVEPKKVSDILGVTPVKAATLEEETRSGTAWTHNVRSFKDPAAQNQ